MRRISTVELRHLEVINLCGGERLGYPCELEIDLDCGQITTLIIPIDSGFSFFGKKEEYVIPWSRIECIGEDAILVKIPRNELLRLECNKNGKKSR